MSAFPDIRIAPADPNSVSAKVAALASMHDPAAFLAITKSLARRYCYAKAVAALEKGIGRTGLVEIIVAPGHALAIRVFHLKCCFGLISIKARGHAHHPVTPAELIASATKAQKTTARLIAHILGHVRSEAGVIPIENTFEVPGHFPVRGQERLALALYLTAHLAHGANFDAVRWARRP